MTLLIKYVLLSLMRSSCSSKGWRNACKSLVAAVLLLLLRIWLVTRGCSVTRTRFKGNIEWIRLNFETTCLRLFCKNELSTKFAYSEREKQFVLTAGVFYFLRSEILFYGFFLSANCRAIHAFYSWLECNFCSF